MYHQTVESAVVIFFVQNFGLPPYSASAVIIYPQPSYIVWWAKLLNSVALTDAHRQSPAGEPSVRWKKSVARLLCQVSACEQRIRARICKVLKKQNKKNFAACVCSCVWMKEVWLCDTGWPTFFRRSETLNLCRTVLVPLTQHKHV